MTDKIGSILCMCGIHKYTRWYGWLFRVKICKRCGRKLVKIFSDPTIKVHDFKPTPEILDVDALIRRYCYD